VEALHRVAIGDFRPDLTLILDLPVDDGLGRAATRSGAETRYEMMDGGFHQRMRQGFREIAAREPERCALIDAARPIAEVAADLLAEVESRLLAR
ncbi:MAG: thymidylate kinase, partial [Inquilinus sp.]|nr:thymidylate kinase [Inquilinus sp.]